MQEGEDEQRNLNDNLIEEEKAINEVPATNEEIPQMEPSEENYSTGNNLIYSNQPLNEKISTQLSLNDVIKIEYEKAIFSDFEKILQYDSFSNEFKPGLDHHLAYPYHFNPTLLNLTRQRSKCDCCKSLQDFLFNLLCKNIVCESILYFLGIFLGVKNALSFLSLFNIFLFIKTLAYFFEDPGKTLERAFY